MTRAAQPRRLALEVRVDAEPIQGRVYDNGDDRRLGRSFCGWLGLIAAIEAARSAHPASSTDQEGEAR